MTGDPLLQVDRLSAWYGRAQILFDLTLEVRRGEVVALMGRNGAGKSTTLKAIMGLVERTQGQTRYNGQELLQLQPFEIARLGLGYVPEDRRIFSDLTVMENLEVGRQRPRDGAPVWSPDKLLRLFPNLGDPRKVAFIGL